MQPFWQRDKCHVRVTDLVESDTCTQISLFSDDIKRQKLEILDECVDRVRERFGYIR